MPMHNGILPREGLYIDPIARLVGKTVLNPWLTLPLVLAGKYTQKGKLIAGIYSKAFWRVKLLLYLGLFRSINNYLSRKSNNNWVSDKYVWSKEIVVVTGGSAGIGAHIVQFLAERGIKVIVLDIQPLTFSATSSVHFFQIDLTSPAKLAAVADEIRARIGNPTILINNAGVVRGKTILDSTERDIRFTFDVNAMAPFWTVKEFLPDMVKKNHGMVVNVSSFAAWISSPEMADYAGSKAAVMAMHETLSTELKVRYKAPRVRTVIVYPGFTKTTLFTGYNSTQPFMIPTMEPESVAEAIVRQVLKGEGGQVIIPGMGNILGALRGFPMWYQNRLREQTSILMTNFQGRQVIKDLDKFYDAKSRLSDGEESTVLVE
ncbi:hypothetical protein PpBr36_01123 [Pyricularia pennisetigena]|uniref:hypothetical protein n=1 Tax=Pyricularia pennisetigena TaxID=1578925 RepID=UPI00114DB88C|nr:hypothetical protein PpBr36_01123 [Pyricularia pennisetigena]TLS28490.1 hypothetical protein PpBr36_01123 [Pyricularia pennisetigena]